MTISPLVSELQSQCSNKCRALPKTNADLIACLRIPICNTVQCRAIGSKWMHILQILFVDHAC